MKKVLLGTSAIALAGAFASQAAAAEWSMKVSGYLEEQVVFTDTDDSTGGKDFNGVDVISDGEIHFSPSITLDNGLKFGARIELEGATNSDQIDENYAYISGSFGQIILGENDNAANAMGYSAPDVGIYNINSGSDTLSLPFAASFGTTSTFVTAGEGDSAGIQYYTPRMAGFQLGVSYARDANRHTDDVNKDEDKAGTLNNIWAVGANYVNTFGDVSIALSAGYTRGSRNGNPAISADSGTDPSDWTSKVGKGFGSGHTWTSDIYCDPAGNFRTNDGDAVLGSDPKGFVGIAPVCASSDTDPEAYAFAGNVGFGGFTVGGSYANYNDQGIGTDRYVWDAGVSYETGPWGFSFTYLNSKIDDLDDKIDKFQIAASYDIASGVKLSAFGVYAKAKFKGKELVCDGCSDREYFDPENWSVVSDHSSSDGIVVGTGVKLSF